MNNLLRIIFLWFLFTTMLYCQGESNNWYFGFGAGVHFNRESSVIPLTDGQVNTYEGCATISDNQGNLLFYTDGKTVYNRQHNIMVNGENLFGQPSSTQSAIIVPKPESTNIYYIFTTNSQQAENPNNGLNFTEVDMSLDNGYGIITRKNIKLLEDSGEKVAVIVKDCSTNSLWLVALGTNGIEGRVFNTYHAFEINASGIVLPSIQSSIGDMSSIEGYLKFSLDGSMLANANMASGLFLYNFDTNTGVISNEQEITINAPADNNSYGVEFSPNGHYLYVHASNAASYISLQTSSLYQYDLLAPDISGSQTILDQSRNLYRAALQLGPNGKIYRSLTENYDRGTSFLGAIHNPNELGLSAEYEHHAVSLNGRLAAQGLPPLVQTFPKQVEIYSYEFVVSENDLELCVGEELNLKATYFPGAYYRWEKDDVEVVGESTNTLLVPVATFDDTGDYQVTVYRPGAEACPLMAKGSVLVRALPEADPYILTSCEDANMTSADGFAIFDLAQIESDSNWEYTYYTSIEAMNNDQPITSPQAYTNTKPYDQYVYYKVVNSNGCENLDEIKLQVRGAGPDVSLEPTYTLCTDNPSLNLTVPANFDTYAWYKVENDNEQIVSSVTEVQILETGNYVLRVGMKYENNNVEIICEQSTEFSIVPSNLASILDVIINDNTEMNTVEIIAMGEGDYEFSIDGTVYQNNNYFENVPSGPITIYVRDKNGCGILEQTIEVDPDLKEVNFPNFFTPNGDGINDYWQYIPDSSGDTNVLSIDIYTRLGKLLVQLNPNSAGWDGSYNGAISPATDYWFRASSINGEIIQGHFSLVR